MADVTDDELRAANEQGRVEFETQPHAASVAFDRDTGFVTLELYNGSRFSFLARELQGLAQASDEDLSAVELSPFGFGVHWPALDADFTVPGLLAGRFGTDRYMLSRRERLGALYQRLIDEARPSDWDAQAAE